MFYVSPAEQSKPIRVCNGQQSSVIVTLLRAMCRSTELQKRARCCAKAPKYYAVRTVPVSLRDHLKEVMNTNCRSVCTVCHNCSTISASM